jgi:putative tryptophan/tyrosine transport system substrate-binding protein
VRRRDFIRLVGGAAVGWPLSARAQQPALPVIGYFSGASFETMHDWITAFKQSLAETGFTEGRDLAIEYRWTMIGCRNWLRTWFAVTWPLSR